MITEAAIFGRGIRKYTQTLRQMAALLSASSVAANLPQTSNGVESEGEEGAEVDESLTAEAGESAAPPNGDQVAVVKSTSKQQQNKKKGKRKRDRGKAQRAPAPASCSKDGGDVGEEAAGGANGEIATLAKLQSYFRVRNGFTMLESQMKVSIF